MKAVLNENGRITLIAETVAEKVVLDMIDVGDEWLIQDKFDFQWIEGGDKGGKLVFPEGVR